MRCFLVAIGLAVAACGAAIIVSGQVSGAESSPGQERDRWGAQIDALVAGKLDEVALARDVARSARRAPLRTEAARMQLQAQSTLMRLDAAHRRLFGTPPIASGGPALAHEEGAASIHNPRDGHRIPVTNDRERLAALIAARTKSASLAKGATGNPAFAGANVLRRIASNEDAAAAAKLRDLHARWFG
ncbi:MAG: hypothetical protein ACSLFR_18330 [Solirubrobacteraceae bacterium]